MYECMNVLPGRGFYSPEQIAKIKSCHAATRVGSFAYGRGGRTAATLPSRWGRCGQTGEHETTTQAARAAREKKDVAEELDRV